MKKVRDLSGSGGISGINITPIIDITLVLLIIMLVAAPVMNITPPAQAIATMALEVGFFTGRIPRARRPRWPPCGHRCCA